MKTTPGGIRSLKYLEVCIFYARNAVAAQEKNKRGLQSPIGSIQPPPPPSEEILGSCESKCGKEPILTHFSPLSKALAPLSEDFYFLVPPLVLSPLLSTPPLKHSDDSVGQNGHNLKSLSGNELVWRQPFAVTPNK